MEIIECVKKYGDTTYREFPMTEVDSLVFSALSYLNFTGVVGYSPFCKTLQELKGDSARLVQDTVHPRALGELLKVVTASLRYRDVKVGYFFEKNDETLPERFAAVSFLLPSGRIYCAFRGTDATLDAWHEDLNMLYLPVIPSQRDAAEYFERLMQEERGEIFVGGHSKGGNLAVFAAAMTDARERLLTVYDHDGPGFRDGFFKTEGYRAVLSRIEKTVPRDSIVGMLLWHMMKFKIVKSKKRRFGQHNLFEWEIKNLSTFETLPSLAPVSRRMEKKIKGFICGMTMEERRMFVRALFEVIDASGAKTVQELKRRKARAFFRMRRAYLRLTDKERMLVKTGGKLLFL